MLSYGTDREVIATVIEGDAGGDDVVVLELIGMVGVIGRAHHLVQLLARAYADDLLGQLGGHGAGEIRDAHGRDLGNEHFPPLHADKVGQHELHSLLQGEPEAGHLGMGDGQAAGAFLDQSVEEGHHRAAGSHHVAVAHYGEDGRVPARHIIGGHEQLVGAELGGTIEVDRVGGLVGGEGDHLLDPIVEGRLDDIFRPIDIGLDALHGVVLGGRHLLEGGGMNHEVHAVHGHVEPLGIAHIADEVAHAGVVEALLHLELLEFITGIDDQTARRVQGEDRLDEFLAKGAGTPGDQDRFSVEHVIVPLWSEYLSEWKAYSMPYLVASHRRTNPLRRPGSGRWRAAAGDRLAHLLHRVEGPRGEAVQFIRVDENEPLLLDGIQHGPLAPVGQHGGIPATGQDKPGVGLDHLLQPDLGVGGAGIRHDIAATTEPDGVARPGRVVDAGERRIPELIEDRDRLGLAVALLQGIESGQIGVGLLVGLMPGAEQAPQAAHLVGQGGKVGGLRVEDGDAELLDGGQHAGLGRAPGHHQIRLLGQQGLQVDAAVVGNPWQGRHLGGEIGSIVGGDYAISGPYVVQQLGQVGGEADDALRGGRRA